MTKAGEEFVLKTGTNPYSWPYIRPTRPDPNRSTDGNNEGGYECPEFSESPARGTIADIFWSESFSTMA